MFQLLHPSLVDLLDSPFQEPQAFADLGRRIAAGMLE